MVRNFHYCGPKSHCLVRRIPLRLPRWAELIPPYAIGSIAMFWVVQCIAAFSVRDKTKVPYLSLCELAHGLIHKFNP